VPDSAVPPVAVPAPSFAQREPSTEPRDVRPTPHAASFPVGYVLIGAGIVVAGATGLEYAWNRGRLNEYRSNKAALQTDIAPGRVDRVTQNNELGASINRASAVTVGLGVAAGALIAGGVVWLFLDPGARSPNDRASVRLERWVPDVVVSRDALAASWSRAW